MYIHTYIHMYVKYACMYVCLCACMHTHTRVFILYGTHTQTIWSIICHHPLQARSLSCFFCSEVKLSCSSSALTGQVQYLSRWGMCRSSLINFISTELVHGFLEINTAVFQ
jgi:hypothetical protein